MTHASFFSFATSVVVGLAIGILCLSPHPICADEAAETGANFLEKGSIVYPANHAVVDITKAPYSAKGDGTTDDTDAIQRALQDSMGQHKLLYFPSGTYLISRTLNWSKQNSAGKDAWGKNFLQGANAANTVIRLKDSTFTDATQPASLMWCGGFGSADWFHNYVQDLTFDVGHNNPGAIGLQFYSNNSGAVRNCRFVARAGSGLVGLDLGHRDMNGPLLVRNCEVIGFQRGISTARAVNGQTFEHITLRGQGQFGFDNEGQSISIRNLLSENSVPAIRSYGTLCLIEARLTGQAKAEQWPAIINYNGGRIFLRDITTRGYSHAVGDVESPDWFAAVRSKSAGKPGNGGPNLREYCSHPATNPFSGSDESLRLKIKEPPEVPVDDPATWANVDDFGADPTGQADSTVAIQKAMDSGAKTIFLPGLYALQSTVVIRGNVRRVLSVGGWVDYLGRAKPDFRVADGVSPSVTFEHFSFIHGGVEIDTPRPVIFRSVSDCDLTCTEQAAGGELFFEDFVTHDLKLNNQRVWARQLNVENEGTHIINERGDLWILGYKTERGGTLIKTIGGGRSEVLGGFSYTTTAGKLAPMFVTDNSSVFTFFNEVCFNGDPYATLIHEVRNGAVVTVKRGEGTTAPYASRLVD